MLTQIGRKINEQSPSEEAPSLLHKENHCMTPQEAAKEFIGINDMCKNPYTWSLTKFKGRVFTLSKIQNNFNANQWTQYSQELQRIYADKTKSIKAFINSRVSLSA